MFWIVVGSGSNEISKVCAEISCVLMYFHSISNLVVCLMYPAVASAGCRDCEQVSC
jgi:hypothetical protein